MNSSGSLRSGIDSLPPTLAFQNCTHLPTYYRELFSQQPGDMDQNPREANRDQQLPTSGFSRMSSIGSLRSGIDGVQPTSAFQNSPHLPTLYRGLSPQEPGDMEQNPREASENQPFIDSTPPKSLISYEPSSRIQQPYSCQVDPQQASYCPSSTLPMRGTPGHMVSVHNQLQRGTTASRKSTDKI